MCSLTIAILILLLFDGSNHCDPESIHVANVQAFGASGNGITDDSKAVQLALNTLEKGGTLYFPPGIYNFHTNRLNFVSTSSLLLLGSGESSILKWDCTELSDPGGYDRGVLNLKGPSSVELLTSVTIRSLAFNFSGGREIRHREGQRGVNIYRTGQVKVESCSFRGGMGEMLGTGNFDSAPGNYVLIRGSKFSDFSQTGANPNSNEAHIMDNEFIQGSTPIEYGRTNGRLRFVGNFIRDMTSNTKIAECDRAEIFDNRFYNCATSDHGYQLGVIGIAGQGSNGAVANLMVKGNLIVNQISHPLQAGILISSGTSTVRHRNIEISGNFIRGCAVGVWPTYCSDLTIRANIIRGGTHGILIPDTPHVSDVVIDSNTISQCTRASIESQAARDRNVLIGCNFLQPLAELDSDMFYPFEGGN